MRGDLLQPRRMEPAFCEDAIGCGEHAAPRLGLLLGAGEALWQFFRYVLHPDAQ